MIGLIKFLKWSLLIIIFIPIIFFIYIYYSVVSFDTVALPENHGQVKTEIFAGSEMGQPLVVGLGGAEGGNGWSGPHGAKQRGLLKKNGYAFLTISYFGSEGTPKNLDRIAIDGIHKAVIKASQDPRINENCIAIMGVSRGGELALLLGSKYSEYKSVIGIVPGSSVFPAITNAMTTPGFSFNGESLPFVPVPWGATPQLLTGDLRGAFEKMMKNTAEMEAAAIKIEDISGPILLISSTKDEQWPSREMSDTMMKRLKDKNFSHPNIHIPLIGGHNEHHDSFDQVIEFLDGHLRSQSSCGRKP